MAIKHANPAFASSIINGPGGLGALRTAGDGDSRLHVMAWLGGQLVAGLDILDEWRQRANDRRVLATMDDRLLRDIGCSRIDAEVESTKPFWRR